MNFSAIICTFLVLSSTEGGGVGFFLACEDYGVSFDDSFSACAFWFFFVLFLGPLSLFEAEISSNALIPLRRPGSVHSGSVNGDNCGQAFP